MNKLLILAALAAVTFAAGSVRAEDTRLGSLTVESLVSTNAATKAQITQEVTDRTAAIKVESDRAKLAEQATAQDLTDEVTRAKAAESSNASNITTLQSGKVNKAPTLPTFTAASATMDSLFSQVEKNSNVIRSGSL